MSVRVVYSPREGARSRQESVRGLLASDATKKESFTANVLEQSPTFCYIDESDGMPEFLSAAAMV